MSVHQATWTNGKEQITGSWEYYWPGDFFWVRLDKEDPITGSERVFKVYGEKPEWGKWKRVK